MQRWIVAMIVGLIINTSANAVSDFWPTGEEWAMSIRQAAYSPATWVPLVGAAIVFVTQTDPCITKWATKNYPVFGSEQNATDQSNHLKDALGVVALGSLLFMPQRDEDKSWLVEKGQYFLVMTAAVGAADGLSGVLKNVCRRVRPNDSTTSYSFPSGHATTAFAFAAVVSRNIDSFNPSYYTAAIFKAGVYVAASGVAWGRVEADAHYTTDVLVGAAIGNFITSSIYNAFLNKPKSDRLQVSFRPVNEGFYLQVDKDF